MTLVRRNDFDREFLKLRGEKVDVSDNVKQVSFQEHFHDLT